MQNNLLEPTDSWYSIWYSIRSSQLSFRVWIPETNLKHMIALLPYSIGKAKRIKNFQGPALESISLTVTKLMLVHGLAEPRDFR